MDSSSKKLTSVELANFANPEDNVTKQEPDTPEGCLIPALFNHTRENKDSKEIIKELYKKENQDKENKENNREHKEYPARENKENSREHKECVKERGKEFPKEHADGISLPNTKVENLHYIQQQCIKEQEKTTDDEKVKGVSKRFNVGSAETIGRRATMEDHTVIYGSLQGNDLEDYFAVFDGHGGIDASKFCSERLHLILIAILREKGSENLSMEKLVKEAFFRCNEFLRQLNTCNETGTTAVVSYSRGNQLWVANVGDSRAVLSRNGQALRITTDHKPGNDSERKRILDLKGFVFFGRVNGVLAVSRALGDFTFSPYVTFEPDVFGPFDVSDRANEFIILACDGLWDVIDDNIAVQIVLDSETPDEGAQQLVCAALNARSTDNISVVVIYFPHYIPKPSKSNQHTSINEI